MIRTVRIPVDDIVAVNELQTGDYACRQTATPGLCHSLWWNVLDNVALSSQLVDHIHRRTGTEHAQQSQLQQSRTFCEANWTEEQTTGLI